MARPGLTGERLAGLFLLGAMLFLSPLIGAFNRPSLVLGLPLLYLYLYLAWIALIMLVALVIERASENEDEAGEPQRVGPEESPDPGSTG